MKRWTVLAAALAAWGMAAGPAWADGMIVPIRPDLRVRGSWAVKYHHVDIVVRDQVASVTVDQEFINTGGGMVEVEYFFPVPPDAAIDAMTLVVNGKEFAATLLKADEARKIYEDIVRRKKDPALLEYAGFGLYRTRAFPLEAGKPAKVVVSYKSVCKKDRNLMEVWYPLNTEKYSSKPIEEVEVHLDAKTHSDIATVYSPSHEVKWSFKDHDTRHVVVTYAAKNVLPLTDFQAFIKTTEKDIGATLLTHQPYPDKDGYFMLLVSPNPKTASKKVVPKDLVLTIDISGTMAGAKMRQARDAVEYVLKNLNKDDRFNVIAFNHQIDSAFKELEPASAKNVEDAKDWVERLEVGGGTNIHEALQKAMRLAGPRKVVKAIMGRDGYHADETTGPEADGRPKYVIFLTDGLPTIGKTDEKDILKDTETANAAGARLFAFGVGYDVNVRLLDRLCGENHGKGDYVKEKEDVTPKITSLYHKIKNPVMTQLTMEVPGLRLRDKYPRELGDLFDGDQIVVVGRFDSRDVADLPRDEEGKRRATVVLKGRFEGRQQAFEYPVTVNAPGKGIRCEFVEKLWAMRRIGYLLDQVQLHGESKEVVDEVIRLSRDYGILTPYTSFLADEGTRLHDPVRLRHAAEPAMSRLETDYKDAAGQVGAVGREMFNSAGAPGGKGFGAAAPSARPTSQPADSAAMIGNSTVAKYEQGKVEYVEGVRQVGNQAVYRRGKTWIANSAADTDLEKDGDKVKTVERFSDEYFELARRNSQDENQLMATQKADEELVVKLRGQVYRIR